MDQQPQQRLLIWPVSLVFDYGTLNISLSSRLDLLNLKKIIEYSKSKGSAGYPMLSYLIWRHIACSHLRLPEKLAWLCFDTYYLLTEIGPERRYQYEQQVLKVSRNCDSERHKDSRKVDCLRFIVLLYLQQFNVIGRKSAVYSMEEWPSTSRQSEIQNHRRKMCNEESHVEFVKCNLDEMVYLLSTDNRHYLNDAVVPLESALALSFLLEGSFDAGRTVLPLHEILLSSFGRRACGYQEGERTFQSKLLLRFIKGNLRSNPYVGENCVSHGIMLNREMVSNITSPSKRKCIIMANSSFAPDSRKLVIISNFYRTTAVENSHHYEHAEVKIHRCASSYIYVLSPLKCASVVKCKNSTIVLAAVETSVVVDSCENVIVITACRRFVIGNSLDTTCYLLVRSNPIVLSGNDRIKFAPFNTNFPSLDQLLIRAGLLFSYNQWDKPITPSLTSCSSTINLDENRFGAFSLLPPEDFYLINVPVKSSVVLDSSLAECVFPLPPEYQHELDKRNDSIDQWKKITKEAELDPEQKRSLQTFVESQFQLWLRETGGKRELDQLLQLSTSRPSTVRSM